MRPGRHRRRAAVAAVAAVMLVVAGPAAAASPAAEVPPTNCRAPVGYQFNATLPGYAVRDGSLGPRCVPFAPVDLPPAGFRGDWLVQRFSDARGRRLLAQCMARPPCAAATSAQSFQPTQFRATGSLVPFGRIDPHAARVDLRAIRRPGFFARAPYREPIARAERRASTFELRVPPDPYERLDRGLTRPDFVRGWYLKGRGVADGRGHRVRALAILLGGRGIETTAVQDPRDPAYTRDPTTGRYVGASYPARGTEKLDARQWRGYLHELWRAGLDVLTFDKRGHGVSGSIMADDTLQQGLDILRAISALDTGSGRAHARARRQGASRARRRQSAAGPGPGPAHADRHRRRQPGIDGHGLGDERELPPLVLVRPAAHAVPPAVGPPQHRRRRAAGELPRLRVPGRRPAPRRGRQARARPRRLPPDLRAAGGHRAPGPGRSSPRACGTRSRDRGRRSTPTCACADRRSCFLYRGPHSEAEGGAANVALAQERLARFAVDAVLRRRQRQRVFDTLEEAVRASPPFWEPSTKPVAAR